MTSHPPITVQVCKRHKRGKPALFAPGWYCARCPAFIPTKAENEKRIAERKARRV